MHRIGIFSGTFDPVHEGHIAFANESMRALSLDNVLFIPEVSPRRKKNVTTIEERIKLLKRRLSRERGLAVFSLDTEQTNSDTTFTLLSKRFPESSFIILIGSDIAFGLEHWDDIETIAQRHSFAIGMRTDADKEKLRHVLEKLSIQASFIYTNHDSISSSQLRTKK